LTADKKAGDFFFESDLHQGSTGPRIYQFDNPFGVPARYHDLDYFSAVSNLDLVEIHLSYKDLEVPLEQAVPQVIDLGLVVHAPELFAGDHTLDLCSLDEDYRAHSIGELQRVVDISRELSHRFRVNGAVLLVTNVGGFSSHRHRGPEARARMLDQLLNSLAALSLDGVELIPQTMPPFPWHFGGQRFHNLFVEPEWIDQFCREHSMRVCLDVSHSKLACNHLGESFSRFLDLILPHTAHLHLADASGVDGEGLQINDGDVDWSVFFDRLHHLAPAASFIPEIWQGHKNQGEGAWIALERLEVHQQGSVQRVLAA
jgi:N-acetylneuraminate synthase